jgi:hypothetical protein
VTTSALHDARRLAEKVLLRRFESLYTSQACGNPDVAQLRRPTFNPFEESTFVETPFSDRLELRTELERNAFQCFGELETAGSKAAYATGHDHDLGCSEYG